MSDLIDRQAAIDAVKDRYYKYDRFAKLEELVWAINTVPSAQPEQRSFSCSQENDLISRQAAIAVFGDVHPSDYNAQTYLDKIKALPFAQPVARDMNVLSNDLIIRQGAIDQLHQSYNLFDAERRLEDMPSAQPERKKGKWYDVGSLSCRCSECGCKSPKEYSFCPNCGADMREGEQNV